jgi:hypothetical protein
VAKERGGRDVPALNDGAAGGGGGEDYSPLDELAKGLASGSISRRKALRLMGAAVVGGVLASIPGVAWAAKGGNSACAQFCRENFPPGPERGECIRAATRGEGICFGQCTFGDPCPVEPGEIGHCCCLPEDPTNCTCCPIGDVCGEEDGFPVCVSP